MIGCGASLVYRKSAKGYADDTSLNKDISVGLRVNLIRSGRFIVDLVDLDGSCLHHRQNSEARGCDQRIDMRSSQETMSEMTSDDIHVLIADDHRMIAEALRGTLLNHGGFVVSLSETLDEALGVLRANRKDKILVLLDITMPGMLGLRSVKQVIDATPNGSVVLFSGTNDADFVWRAINLGAKGFISKSQQLRSLPTTLQLIHDGNEFVPMSLSRRDEANEGSDSSLSDTDLFILRAVAEGKTNKEIALEINRSEVAVKMKMRSICQRLNARNRAHAVIVASRANLL